MAISKKIQKVMRERGLSYMELSKITGISPSSLQSYGSGRSKKVPFHVIETLSEKLRLPIEFWLAPDEDAPAIRHDVVVSKELKEQYVANAKDPSPRNQFLTDLLELAELFEKGLLTKEEYDLGKRILLEGHKNEN